MTTDNSDCKFASYFETALGSVWDQQVYKPQIWIDKMEKWKLKYTAESPYFFKTQILVIIKYVLIYKIRKWWKNHYRVA